MRGHVEFGVPDKLVPPVRAKKVSSDHANLKRNEEGEEGGVSLMQEQPEILATIPGIQATFVFLR